MTAENHPREGIVVSKNLETLAHALDGLFRIPGTDWRFGLDALVGMIPGVGDAATSVAAFSILVAAVRYRVPKVVILRMALNLAIDYVVGSIPLVGDAFDFVWKANTKNLRLLKTRGREVQLGAGTNAGDYVFVAVVCVLLVGLLVACAALAIWILAQLLHAVSP